MKFTDKMTIAGTRMRDDGYLVADARIARTGIQTYAGWEVGKPDMPVVRVYRPDAEVFARDAMASFAHRPVTNDHPAEQVTADNWKAYAVGQTADEIARDGSFLRVPLMVSDASAIKEIEDGKRELSAGYTSELVWGDGTTPDGEAYDATQTNIRANHVAIVRHGRAGSEVRIGDGATKWGASPVNLQTADERKSPMADALRKILVDGLQVETTDAGAAAIEKLTNDLKASAAKLTDAEKANSTAIAAKDAEIAKKDAEIDELKKKIVDGATLDKMVADRAILVNKAKVLAKDVKTDGLSDAEIKKAVVAAVIGDAAKDKSESYIDARFDILVEDAAKKAGDGVDPFAAAVKDGVAPTATADKAVVDAYAQMVKDMQSAHRPATAN